MQKISVNAGFSCPNRDGTIGTGGCIYCDNSSFTPGYCFRQKDIASQLNAGKAFFGKKYPKMKYLAYFQSFSNTFGRSADELETMYREAMGVEGVVGLIIGTRPD
ncbi:MAG: TIGR01212 family radical SAM protein, partial [Muribaculaceae bacterium]|nr:TIGR01212 family radical SAM protein [Muribaculaceae bacterium]